MNIDDVYLIMQDSLHMSLYETLFVYVLVMVLLLCLVVIAICDVVEPRHNEYRESMWVQTAEHISKWNKTHLDSQIELRGPK